MQNNNPADKTTERAMETHDAGCAVWVALHRRDGAELTSKTAPGYYRVPYSEWGAKWPKAPTEWGWVAYYSGWNAPRDGRRISDLHPVTEEHIADG